MELINKLMEKYEKILSETELIILRADMERLYFSSRTEAFNDAINIINKGN